MNAAGWLALTAGAYLVGGIPFGVIIGRLHGVDIRDHGSRNIGATNVGRVLGRRWGIACFILDAAKGALPVLAAGVVARTLHRSAEELGATTLWWWLLVAAAAIAGHMCSPFIGFKGGKGVATGFGALAAFWPLLAVPAVLSLVVWIVTVKAFRFVSLASIVAAAALPLFTCALSVRSIEAWPLVAATISLAALVIVRHRSNIGRLRRGEEPRIGAAHAGGPPTPSTVAPGARDAAPPSTVENGTDGVA